MLSSNVAVSFSTPMHFLRERLYLHRWPHMQ